MIFDNLEDLFKHVDKKVGVALKKSVAPIVRKTMQEHIQSDVYDAYPFPSKYERRGHHGGLIDGDNIIDEVSDDNVLTVANVTPQNLRYGTLNRSKPLTEIIQEGDGYLYSSPDGNRGYEYPRPFIDNTIEELEDTGKAVSALKRGLKAQGLDVE